MKKEKILFWSATTLIALFEGLMPILTFNTDMAKDGIRHLGYPDYFGTALVVFKVLGALALIIPMVPKRFKEWAYAGMFINLIGASVSCAVMGFEKQHVIMPLVVLAFVIASWALRPASRRTETRF